MPQIIIIIIALFLAFAAFNAAIVCLPLFALALVIHAISAVLLGSFMATRASLRQMVTETYSSQIINWQPDLDAIKRAYAPELGATVGTILSGIMLISSADWMKERFGSFEKSDGANLSVLSLILVVPLSIAALIWMWRFTLKKSTELWNEVIKNKVSKINIQLDAVVSLYELELENRELADKLGALFESDYSSEAKAFVSQNHAQLVSSSETRIKLDTIIGKAEKFATQERNCIQQCIKAYAEALALLKSTTPAVVRAGANVLIEELECAHSALHSDNLKGFITAKNFSAYHRNIALIVQLVRDVERTATTDFDRGASDDYSTLDLPASATREEIVERKKKYAQIFHPDLLSGMSADARSMAEQKLMRINQAADALLKKIPTQQK